MSFVKIHGITSGMFIGEIFIIIIFHEVGIFENMNISSKYLVNSKNIP